MACTISANNPTVQCVISYRCKMNTRATLHLSFVVMTKIVMRRCEMIMKSLDLLLTLKFPMALVTTSSYGDIF